VNEPQTTAFHRPSPADASAPAHASAPNALRAAVREITSGGATAVVLLAWMLLLALIAYAPLSDYVAAEMGVRAALAAAVFGFITAILIGSPLLPSEVPRASTVLVFATIVQRLVDEPGLHLENNRLLVAEVLFLSATCIGLSGLVQIAFGALRLGSIARFVPYPVVAGFMTGLAVSLAIYEIPELIGAHHGAGGEHEASAPAFHAWPFLIGIATIAAVVLVSRFWPKGPSRLVGIIVGTLLAALVMNLVPHAQMGQFVPQLEQTLPWPNALAKLATFPGLKLIYDYRYIVASGALVLAVVGSLDSLMSAVGETDGPLEQSHQPNRLLVTLGLGNVFSALFGGLPMAYSSIHSSTTSEHGSAHAAGHGGNLVTSIATMVTLLLLLLYGTSYLERIPMAVFAGVNMTLAFGLFDRWARGIVQRGIQKPRDAELRMNLVVVLFVAAITAIFGPVPAVVVGFVLSMVIFIAVMNRSLVRSAGTGESRASRRVNPLEQTKLLRDEGHRIALLELDGALFFGTAERLSEAAEQAAKGAQFLILDLDRVTMIDASGALMLERLGRRLREQSCKLLLAHVTNTNRLGASLIGAGLFTEKHHPDWFEDTDRALEWAERQILIESHAAIAHQEIPIEGFALMAGLTPEEREFMKRYLDRQRFSARSPLFRKGDAGDRMYLLAKGAVSIVAEGEGAEPARRRVVTLAPGVMFGESALFEGETRAFTALPEEESVLYSLSRQSLESIRSANPDLHRRLVLNMLKHVADQLRLAIGVVRETGEAPAE
jgi:MFS superfamily sulfate permease-like transporter/CRP-like cAMP-binding protein